MVFPLFRVHKKLILATGDPQDLNALDEIKKLTGYTLSWYWPKTKKLPANSRIGRC